MGETRVDLRHLLEDIRDAYTGSIEETIVTEVVANALDAGATTIHITTDPGAASLTIVDNGRGMQRRELARYHDIAASTKRRGEGIGFAGVGIKLGLLVSREVFTETRRGRSHVASAWSLVARHRAPWRWTPPLGLVTARGTAVRLQLENPLSPLVDAGFLDMVLRQHFEPLLDPRCRPILARHYGGAVTFTVDGHPLLAAYDAASDVVPISIRMARKRTPAAQGYLVRTVAALPDERAGLAISTLGKVILRGWDWLGLSPALADRVSGVIEAPALAECLTLNKNGFLRTGPRGATYLAYRKALQDVVSRQLAEWGDAPGGSAPPPRPARLDRDLERVLEDLAAEFPLLHSLVERRRGGQRRLPIPGRTQGDPPGLLALSTEPVDADAGPTRGETPAGAPDAFDAPAGEPTSAAGADHDAGATGDTAIPAGGLTRRRTRYGLSIQFESRPDDAELGRLVDSVLWVNQSHPAFLRAASSRSVGYHLALTVALALAPLAVTAPDEHAFLTRFLAEWGQVGDERNGPRDRKQRRRVR